MFAQSLVEYGALASVVSSFRQIAYDTLWWFQTLSPTAWGLMGLLAFLALFFKWRH